MKREKTVILVQVRYPGGDCTSDIYAGRRDADEVSAGYAFHGKFVVEAVVDDLLTKALFEVDIPQLVLMGMSAGIV